MTRPAVGPRAAALVLLALLATAPSARAQGCAGPALEPGRWDVGALAAAVREPVGGGIDGVEVGAAVAFRPRARLRFEVAAARRALSGAGADPWLARARGYLSLEGAPLLSRLPVTPCLTAGAGAALARQEATDTEYLGAAFPLGLSLARRFRPADGATVTPYAAPQLLLGLVDGEVLGVPVSESGVAGGLELGVGARIGDVGGDLSLFLSGVGPELGTAPWPERLLALRLSLLL